MVDNHDNTTEPFTPGVSDQPAGETAPGPGEDAVLDLIAAEGMGEQKKRSGALVIVGVVVLAAAGLFSMHTLTQVKADDGADPSTSKTVDDFLKGLGPEGGDEDKHLEAIAVIEGDYTSPQVPVEQVTDPFLVAQVDPGDPKGGPVVSTGNCEEDAKQAIKDIKVQAVMLGARPTAFINGKTVQVGHTIEVRRVKFKITAIGNDSVTVLAECPEDDIRVEETVFMRRW
jgi:hypothetical protein